MRPSLHFGKKCIKVRNKKRIFPIFMENLSILVVDDEKEIVELLEIYLVSNGYQVYKAYHAEEGLQLLEKEKIVLVVLDIMMPGMDGLEMCRQIRKSTNIPIIILSAKSSDFDKIIGLGAGADDYVVKPFNPLEIVARIRSQLRRYLELNQAVPREEDPHYIELDDVKIDSRSRVVTVGEEEVKLTPLEFDLLHLLASNQGQVFSIEEIFSRLWKGSESDPNNTVMVHIRRLREKLGEKPRAPKYIKTVWGVGYTIE